MKFKPVIAEEEATHYVSDSDMIRFISKNAPMDHNECCSYVVDTGITNADGPTFWRKCDITNKKQHRHYNEHQIKWVTAFFEAHPFIERIMLVFDD